MKLEARNDHGELLRDEEIHKAADLDLALSLFESLAEPDQRDIISLAASLASPQ